MSILLSCWLITMKNNSVDLIEKKYHRDELTLGLKVSDEVWYKHAQYEERGPSAQAQYDRLKVHLTEHGMINPLITYRGHVLIGQRRFEILRETQETFDCLEVDENMSEWTGRRVPILTQTVRKVYGERAPNIPTNL